MVRVRAAEAADIARLVEIAEASANAAQWNRNEYVRLFAQQPWQSRVALVIEEGAEAVGFIVGKQVEQEWEIENVAIIEAGRRRGLGSQLLREFLAQIQRHGGREVWLEVRVSNLAARALYGKWGFVEAGRRKAYYENPAEDALILKFNFS